MPLMTKGERIRELRERRALTRKDLAARMGTTANYVAKVELGHRNGGNGFVRSAAAALNVRISDITEYVPDRPRVVAS